MVARLTALGIPVTRTGSLSLQLPAQHAAGLDRVWRATREAGAVVRALEPVQERFEDVFLQALATRPQEAPRAAS